MNERKSKLRVGIFVTTAAVLLLMMLFFLGLSEVFVRKVCVVTTFTESVQGLSVGSDVKFRGVKIGSVKSVSIMPEMKTIKVEMAVESDRFTGIVNEQELISFIKKEMSQGLRCRLEFAGITGLRYLDFDYFAAPGEPPATPRAVSAGFVMPSVPSALRDVVKSLNVSLERISKIQFEDISNNLVNNLNDLNKILASEDVRRSIAHLSSMAVSMDKTAAAFSQIVTEDRLRQILDELELSLTELRTLAIVVRQDAEKSDIAGTAASVRQAADSLSGLVREEKTDLKAAVDAWIRSLDMFRELMDTLNRDPASVIRGRQ